MESWRYWKASLWARPRYVFVTTASGQANKKQRRPCSSLRFDITLADSYTPCQCPDKFHRVTFAAASGAGGRLSAADQADFLREAFQLAQQFLMAHVFCPRLLANEGHCAAGFEDALFHFAQ